MGISLTTCTHWIFDMDGTLTIAVHDFAAIRAALNIPETGGIIEAIDSLPADEAKAKHQQLEEIELDYARQALPQPNAHELLQGLSKLSRPMGILTRNSRQNALVTLAACNLLDFFQPEHILGRESAAPKPSPAGIEMLLKMWGAQAEQAVICGDFRYDLEAGRNANTATVYVDIDDENEWTNLADFRVLNLSELKKLITS